MTITTLLFDLDGTLIDSAQETAIILNDMRRKRGMPPCDISLFRDKISTGAAGLVKCALNCNTEDTQVLVDEFRTRYQAITTPKSSIFPDVEETLSHFKRAGYKLAVVSNKPDNLCRNVMQQTELSQFFDCIIGSTPSLNSKPHPDPIWAALERTETHKTEAVLIGDSLVDQRAAAESGIPFIFYAQGYNDGVEQDSTFACITQFQELRNLIMPLDACSISKQNKRTMP